MQIPITIKASSRLEDFKDTENPREAFWSRLREEESYSNSGPKEFEATLHHEFGGELADAIKEHFSEALRGVYRAFPGRMHIDDWMLHRRLEPRSKYTGHQELEYIARYAGLWREQVAGNPHLRRAEERIAAVSSVVFVPRITGYSSLNFDLSIGGLEQLASSFDNNFETFRLFLEAFIPKAFGDTFDDDFARTLDFDVSYPPTFQNAFEEAEGRELAPTPEVSSVSNQIPTNATKGWSAERKAKWIQRFVTGSLLVPLSLSLVVMWKGLQILSETQATQSKTLEPAIEYQLQLLKEDRARMESLIRAARTRPDKREVPSPTLQSEKSDSD